MNVLIDVLLESEAAYSTAIEELRKKIDEIVKELNALKEVHALQLGAEQHFYNTYNLLPIVYNCLNI